MKKPVALALVAFALVLAWGAALLDVGKPDAAPRAEPAAAPSAPEESAPLPLDAGGSLGHGLEVTNGFRDREFQAMAKRYATEPRDDPWASEEEHRLAVVLGVVGWHANGRAHCRRTVCRIELPGGAPADLAALLAAPAAKELRVSAKRAYEIDNGALQTYTYRAMPDGGTP